MGRNAYEDRTLIKVPLKAHIEQFRIEKLGGIESARKFVINAIKEKTDENDKV